MKNTIRPLKTEEINLVAGGPGHDYTPLPPAPQPDPPEPIDPPSRDIDIPDVPKLPIPIPQPPVQN